MAAAAEMSLTERKFANECQIGLKWRLKEEDVRNIQDGWLDSKKFHANIPGVKYSLRIHPNGTNEENTNSVSIFFNIYFKTVKRIVANYTISIKSASKTEITDNLICNQTVGCGSTLCSRDDLFDPEKGFFINGIMEVELEGILTPRGIKRKASKPLSLGSVLWKNEEGKDLTMVADKEELKIHKWILCAKSPVFKAELQSEFKEAKEKKINIIDFTAETVQIFIEYCYERDIKEQINENNASELLHFTDKYDIKSMHDLIQTELIEKISEANVVQFANMSVTSNAENLIEFCVCFLVDAAKRSSLVDDMAKLDDEIAAKVCRRSFFSTS